MAQYVYSSTGIQRIRDQKAQMVQVEKNIQKAQQSLKEVNVCIRLNSCKIDQVTAGEKNLFVSGGPAAYLAKMQEDVKVNKYLATENLPLVCWVSSAFWI